MEKIEEIEKMIRTGEVGGEERRLYWEEDNKV